MKSFNLITCSIQSLGLLCVALVSTQAAETAKPLVAHARTAAPAAATPPSTEAPVLLLSTFVVPQKAAEGRDPFFPNSPRVYGENAVTNRTATVMVDLVLKGISGTIEKPLAIINTTTFTVGEINEVILKNGRMRIQCVEINMAAGTVLLQIGTVRRELRLGEK